MQEEKLNEEKLRNKLDGGKKKKKKGFKSYLYDFCEYLVDTNKGRRMPPLIRICTNNINIL